MKEEFKPLKMDEAIKNLNEQLDELSMSLPFTDAVDMITMATGALMELQEYRKIGTVDECRAAVEKQKPKKPDIEGDGYADGKLVYDTWICPNCNKRYEIDYDDYDYCPNCGQHIDRSDWSDEDV